MAERVEIEPRHAMQVAGLVATAGVALNIVFYFLSDAYFDDRSATYGVTSSADISAVRYAFLVFSGLVSLGALAATLAPRVVGHALAGAAGLVALIGAVGAIRKDMHVVLPAALILIGVLLPLLVRGSLKRGRSSWAFLLAICATFAAVTLFGSTKVRAALDIGLWHALIFPGLLAVATVALAMVRDDYRDA